jgi:hypothetical protein
MFISTVIPIDAKPNTVAIEKQNIVIRPSFTNISLFYNDFYITDQGKAFLTSSVDARNVDECKVRMDLQKYQNGRWTTVKSWSKTENGTFCGLGEAWYVMSGYQYRMVSYSYVYEKGSLLESTTYTSKSRLY